jgi:hypothetical protein
MPLRSLKMSLSCLPLENDNLLVTIAVDEGHASVDLRIVIWQAWIVVKIGLHDSSHCKNSKVGYV